MPDVNEHVRNFKVTNLYEENDPVINEQFKQLLKQHNDLNDTELVKHVRKVVSQSRIPLITQD